MSKQKLLFKYQRVGWRAEAAMTMLYPHIIFSPDCPCARSCSIRQSQLMSKRTGVMMDFHLHGSNQRQSEQKLRYMQIYLH